MSEVADVLNKTNQKIDKLMNRSEVFDPRLIEDNENRALWTSDSVDLAVKGLSEGYKLKESPFIKTVRDARLRKANVPFKYTEDEMEIINMCMDDKYFFCDNFGKLKDGDKGWVNIKLRDYQRNLLKRYDDNRWNIILFPRQSGKTTTTVLEIVYFCIFNVDKDCVVIAQSDKVVSETLTKIKECFAGLPYFLQPGFISFNKKGFTLDNGCRLSIGIASESVVQGFSLDMLYIDEFGYIKQSLVDKFWNNVYPTLINNPKSRCIITSTPNGRNKFHSLWVGAESKQNKFVPYRIYWYDVPGRDEQFKIDTIANVGEEGWLMGFECSFDTQLKSIFNSRIQINLRNEQRTHQDAWSKDNHPIGNMFNMEFISQDIIPYNLATDYFVAGIDLGEGLEQDETILKIKKLVWDIEKQKIAFKSIAVFHDNTISVEDFAEMNLKLFKYFNKDRIRIVVETNSYGGEYFAQIDNLVKFEPRYMYFNNQMFAQFMRDSKDDFERGIRWNQYNKKTAVKSFANLVGKGLFQETHYLSLEEYLNFGKAKNDTYKANYGHDDLVMADVTISAFIKANNLFSRSYFEQAEYDLRIIADDVDKKIIEEQERLNKIEENKYRRDGFILRNHDEEYEKRMENMENSILI